MANVSIMGASYSDVPAVQLPQTGGGIATFYEENGSLPITQNGTYNVSGYASAVVNISGGSISISDLPNATGTTLVVTGDGGGGGGATQHEIYFEFSDSTNTTIDVYYDDPLIGTMITAYEPVTYGGKTVTLAQLDGVTWYEPADIPLNTQLIDYTKVTQGYYIGDDGELHENEWSYVSDYVEVEPNMTFSYTCFYWYYIGVYDKNKNLVRAIYAMNDATQDQSDGNTGHGTLSGTKLSTASYVRICGGSPNSSYMSLIRTA